MIIWSENLSLRYFRQSPSPYPHSTCRKPWKCSSSRRPGSPRAPLTARKPIPSSRLMDPASRTAINLDHKHHRPSDSNLQRRHLIQRPLHPAENCVLYLRQVERGPMTLAGAAQPTSTIPNGFCSSSTATPVGTA